MERKEASLVVIPARMLVLGSLVALVWLFFGLFGGSTSASATENQNSDEASQGTVASLLTSAMNKLSDQKVFHSVEDVVHEGTRPVAEVSSTLNGTLGEVADPMLSTVVLSNTVALVKDVTTTLLGATGPATPELGGSDLLTGPRVDQPLPTTTAIPPGTMSAGTITARHGSTALSDGGPTNGNSRPPGTPPGSPLGPDAQGTSSTSSASGSAVYLVAILDSLTIPAQNAQAPTVTNEALPPSPSYDSDCSPD